MSTLVCRPGDSQAIKAATAALLSGASLAIANYEDVASWKKLAGTTAGAFGQKSLFLVLADGSVISEPNAMFRCLGTPSCLAVHLLLTNCACVVTKHHNACRPLAPDSPTTSLEIESWVEWEEHCLRPAVYASDATALQAAVQRLGEGLQGRKYLTGSQLSMADVVVYATLQPLIGSHQVKPGHEWRGGNNQAACGAPPANAREVVLHCSAAKQSA